MIYYYIEKKLLRRAIVMTHLFYDNQVHILQMAQQLNVSSITIRNDLLHFEERFGKQIRSIVTNNGLISMELHDNVNLHALIFEILRESLFLKYLFLNLMDTAVTIGDICENEKISASRARSLMKAIRQFLGEEFPPPYANGGGGPARDQETYDDHLFKSVCRFRGNG